jgi:hypothetical protein
MRDRVRRRPNPGMSIFIFLRNGDVKLSRNSKVIFRIQYVSAMGAIAKRPARITFLKCCHMISFHSYDKVFKIFV